MNWIDQTLQPEEPGGCDLCVRVAEAAPPARILALPVPLPCGSLIPVLFHTYQVN